MNLQTDPINLQLTQTLDLVLERLATVVPHESSAILLVHDSQVQVASARGYAHFPNFKSASYHLSQCTLLSKIITHHDPSVLSGHIEGDPFYESVCYGSSCSCINMPLWGHDQVIGVLTLNRNTGQTYDVNDSKLLAAFAEQAALTIENAHLYAQAQRRLQVMQELHAVTLDIVAEMDLNKVLQTLLQRAARLTQAEGAALFRWDADANLIRNISSLNTWRDYRGTVVKPGEGLIGRVVATGEALIVNDYSNWDGRITPFIESPQTVVMGVPLKWRGKIVGGLTAMNPPDAHQFEEQDLWALGAMADLASIALENAGLYAEVKSFNKNLERQVQERTSELVQAREQIAQKAEEVEWLLSKTVHIQEEERARIARDLHDGVDQLIVGAMYELQTAKAGLDNKRYETAQKKIDEVRELLHQVEQEIRRVIYDLRPTYLDAGDLDAALRKYAASFQDLAGISCAIETIGNPIRLPVPIEVIIFRIGQEALHNVMKHAQATEVRVRLEFQTQNLLLQVADNGRGFALTEQSDAAIGRGLGLTNIRERANAIGGVIEVESQPQQGTRITFRLPLAPGLRR